MLLRRRRERRVRGVAVDELREKAPNEELHLLLARVEQRRRGDALPELANGDDDARRGAQDLAGELHLLPRRGVLRRLDAIVGQVLRDDAYPSRHRRRVLVERGAQLGVDEGRDRDELAVELAHVGARLPLRLALRVVLPLEGPVADAGKVRRRVDLLRRPI